MIKRIKPIMKIYNFKNIMELKELPILNDGSYYIYCILNSAGNIKIGITTDIVQRLRFLSGSNSAGYKMTSLALSSPTYVSSAEKAFHNKYARYRLEGEWFDGSKITFEEIVKEMTNQFNTQSYNVCNQIRKELVEKRIKECEKNKVTEELEKSKPSNKTKTKTKRNKNE